MKATEELKIINRFNICKQICVNTNSVTYKPYTTEIHKEMKKNFF